MRVEELSDSSRLVTDPEGLRRRLAADGYLFFRGLLPEDEIWAAGQIVLERLRSGGWVDDKGIPSIQPRAVNSMDALADTAFRAAMFGAALTGSRTCPSCARWSGASSDPGAFSYPAKVLRAVYPERPQARPRCATSITTTGCPASRTC